MKYLVLGAGMMGSAVAFDLARSRPGDTIVLADLQEEVARSAARAIGPNVVPIRLDVHDSDELFHAIEGCAVIISAASYAVNEEVTRAAIHAGVHMCDLGGNNDVVRRQLALNAEARARGVTILPNNGLAPGLINILARAGMQEFDEVDEIHLRVGGLPQHPRPPLNYQIVFSVEGLINEYVENAEILQAGKVTSVSSMTGVEEIIFPAPFGALEAFHTSGGISTLTRELEGKVRTLDYKTIRYKGHCEKFRTLLDLDFATAEPVVLGGYVTTRRELFTDLLQKKLSFGDKDVVLARATLTGSQAGARRTLVYELIDHYDEKARMTAMMRTTAFPTAIIAQFLADGTITTRGVMPPEECVREQDLLPELEKRNIRILKQRRENGK